MQIQHWIDAQIGISLFELPNHKMAVTNNDNIRCHMLKNTYVLVANYALGGTSIMGEKNILRTNLKTPMIICVSMHFGATKLVRL